MATSNSQLTAVATTSQLQDKWGQSLDEGFVLVPSALLKHQSELRLTDGEVLVLINLFMSWWKKGELPFPRAVTLAKRMGVSQRTVLRHMAGLEEKNLIERIGKRSAHAADRKITKYDLTGVVERLKLLTAETHRRNAIAAAGSKRVKEQPVFLD